MSYPAFGTSEDGDLGCELTTIQPGALLMGGVRRVPCLTIACHPDLGRVGEEARLTSLALNEPVEVSRLSPAFGRPGSAAKRSLKDPGVSRSPLRMRPLAGGSIELTWDPKRVSLAIDDHLGGGEYLVTPTELERGVVLTVGERVVLLLNAVGPRIEVADACGLVGESEAVNELRRRILQVADLNVAVFLRGETGSGKDLVARAIHDRSRYRDGPYVPHNMAEFNAEGIAGSRLFGHVKGAFTGAYRDQDGVFVQADGGTLFLDEIAELDLVVQGMLLRVLETQQITPIGAQRSRQVNVRIVSATDADLQAAAAEGRFKQPLQHRLLKYRADIPPLRSRRDDIGRLLVHFLREESEAHRQPHQIDAPDARSPPWLCAEIVTKCLLYDWPGNVRELSNFASQLVIESRDQPTLVFTDAMRSRLPRSPAAPVELGATGAGAAGSVPAATDDPAGAAAPRTPKPSEITGDVLRSALRDNNHGIAATARHLGIARVSLYALLARFGVPKAKELDEPTIRAALADHGGDIADAAAEMKVSERALRLRMRELDLVD